MKIFQKNLIAIKKHHPQLIKLIKNTNIDNEKIMVLPTTSGDHRILYKRDDGSEVYIHNEHDPSIGAKQAIDLMGQMDKEGIAILFGFGLGYFAEEVLELFDSGQVMIVYEAVPEIFKTALRTRDLTKLLTSGKIEIVLGKEMNNFLFPLEYHHLLANGKFWIVKHHPSLKLDEKAYQKFQEKMENEKRITGSNIATIINLGKEFINSFMDNIPSIIRTPGVLNLKDIFKGRPAIIVSAGPSLEKNLHLLKKTKGKAIIVAVDAVLQTILPVGIVPDIVVGIDPLPDNFGFFYGNPLLKHVPFVCLCQYTPKTLDSYPGPIFINMTAGNIIFQWLCNFWEEKGFIESGGGSVAHLAFSVAEYIGCSSIALTGQDLSFSKNLHAGSGMELLHDYIIKNEECAGFFNYTRDTKMVDSRESATVVKNIAGEDRYTNDAFLAFKTAFETKANEFPGSVIHASEDGLPIKGTTIMRLVDFIDTYCNIPEIDTFSILTRASNREIRYNIDDLLLEIDKTKSLFTNIRRNGKKILHYVQRLEKLIERNQKDCKEFHNILRKIESLTEKVKSPMLNIIAAYHYKLELYLKGQDTKSIDDMVDKWERLDKQLERAKNYYPEVIEAIDIFNKRLDKLINAMELEKRVNTIIMDESLSEYIKYSKVARLYNRANRVNQAVKYTELAINALDKLDNDMAKDKNYPKHGKDTLQISLAELYINQSRFLDAKEILDEIDKSEDQLQIEEGSESHLWQNEKTDSLLAVCEEKINVWNKRKEDMGVILKKAVENYGNDFESAEFYYKVKDYEMAEKKYLAAINECQNQTPEKQLMNKVNGSPPLILKAYYGLANTYIAMERIEEVVEILGQIIELDPSNPEPYCDMGRIAALNDKFPEAEAFLMKAIELAPYTEKPYKLLANLYINYKMPEKASLLYENAIKINPANPIFAQWLAEIYTKMIATPKLQK